MSAHTDCLHPKTAVARRACRDSRNRKALLVPMIDAAYGAMMVANATEPYDHAEYERWDRVLKGLLIAFTEGDQEWADAFRWFFTDSGETMSWYLSQGSRDQDVYDAGTYDKTNEEELEKSLGVHWSQLEEYADDQVDPDTVHDALVDAELGV